MERSTIHYPNFQEKIDEKREEKEILLRHTES